MDLLAEKQRAIAAAVARAVQHATAAGSLSLQGDVPPVHVEVPNDKSHGDFATNHALVLASVARRPPRQIAEIIVQHLDPAAVGAVDVQVAGPGFINFTLEPGWLREVVRRVRAAGTAYGPEPVENPQSIVVEFVSANPVGPMNVVNARAAAVGDCLVRLLQAVGHRVAREYYVNDAGRQAELFGLSVEARFRQLEGQDVELPEGGYPGEYVIEVARRLREERPDALSLPDDERRRFFTDRSTDIMVEMQREDLKAFGVEFDRWFRERELHRRGDVARVVEVLRERGYVYERDGAVWFASTRFGDDKDRVLIKQDGDYTYLTADIAYHDDKFRRGFDRAINLWGPDHHGYIARTKAAVQALGYGPDALEVLILQLVTLLRGGRQVRMSKRAGEFVTLRDLLEEVGRDAARYFFLMRSPESHLEFDLELAVAQSADNPVYYVQYAHARICSIFRQATAGNIPLDVDLSPLGNEYEEGILRALAAFPQEVRLAAERREPQRMTRYLHELASAFHSFYNHCRVLGEPPEVEAARLALLDATRLVLSRGLSLLGVSAPEKM